MSKKLFILPLFLFGAFLAVTTTSCGDNCKDVECNTGTCLDGTCECGVGYEGTNCEIESSGKFVGNYDGTDICNTGTFDYSMKISRVTEGKVLLEDLGGTVYDIEANVELVNASDASAQKISFNYTTGGRVFVGQGVMSGSIIAGAYTISQSGTVTDDCTFTLVKK